MNPGIAAVTGASSGIGEEFARQLAARGYGLLLIARREDRLTRLAEELRRSPGVDVMTHAADLTDDADLERVAQQLEAMENLELLVNNAGFGSRGLFFETSIADHARMHRLHVMATLRLSHAALKNMVSRDRGGIIQVSSVAAFGQSPENVSYCSTKAWVNSFTNGLWVELKNIGSRVRVQALCPGYTYSEFHDVLGMDRGKIPRPFWLPAQRVVRASLEGLDRGKRIVIPGWSYRFAAAMLQLLPMRLLALRRGPR